MANKAEVQGHQNIVIQGVTDSTITVQVNGELTEVLNKLDDLLAFVKTQGGQTIQSAEKTYDIGAINEANFGYLVSRAVSGNALPRELQQELVTDTAVWVQSLKQELVEQGVSVGNRPWDIFRHYGWIIETFLQKMQTPAGQERSLRRLSFMTEAYHSALRYLCYIQVAQLLQREHPPQHPALSEFLQMEGKADLSFDYLNLLIVCTDLLRPQPGFMPEIDAFAAALADPHSDLYATALFLDQQRLLLLNKALPDDGRLEALLDEYLTGLLFWLRNMAFLAKYRLVSIKNISLSYRLGSGKLFVHLYGELHGMYNEAQSGDEEYNEYARENVFTYNKSVLLLKGSNVESGLENIQDPTSYLSLSPLVIDESVFLDKPTQTPEIYYYTGYESGARQYRFAQYKNELPFGAQEVIASNKEKNVRAQNNQQPKLNELFKQLDQLFKPFKNAHG